MAKDSTPIDDANYVDFIRRLMDTTSGVVDDAGYTLNGMVILVEVDGQGVTIASSLDSDEDTRRILAEAIARSHNVISRQIE